MSLGDLKPSEELMVGTVAVGAVAAIYQGFLPNIADIAAGDSWPGVRQSGAWQCPASGYRI